MFRDWHPAFDTDPEVSSVASRRGPNRAAGDMIQGFSIDASGTRVLLTIGGDRQDLWMAEGFVRPTASWRRWFRHWEAPS